MRADAYDAARAWMLVSEQALGRALACLQHQREHVARKLEQAARVRADELEALRCALRVEQVIGREIGRPR